MSTFTFVQGAGERLPALDPETITKHLSQVGLSASGIKVAVDGTTATVAGDIASQEGKEKILLAVGNICGIAQVEDTITVTGDAEPAARFVVVKQGDTLSSIATAEYGNSNMYNKIYEGNKPMLTSPSKAYPGMVLRIPQ